MHCLFPAWTLCRLFSTQFIQTSLCSAAGPLKEWCQAPSRCPPTVSLTSLPSEFTVWGVLSAGSQLGVFLSSLTDALVSSWAAHTSSAHLLFYHNAPLDGRAWSGVKVWLTKEGGSPRVSQGFIRLSPSLFGSGEVNICFCRSTLCSSHCWGRRVNLVNTFCVQECVCALVRVSPPITCLSDTCFLCSNSVRVCQDWQTPWWQDNNPNRLFHLYLIKKVWRRGQKWNVWNIWFFCLLKCNWAHFMPFWSRFKFLDLIYLQ